MRRSCESLDEDATEAVQLTIRVFDPSKGFEGGQDDVVPVDSPDAEHAVASTMASAVSFSKKTDTGKPLAVAFTCIEVEPP